MRTRQNLERILSQADGRGYSAYKELLGDYDLGPFRLAVDHVQVDPYAPPSRMRVIVGRQTTGIPDDLLDGRLTRVATADFLARRVHEALRAAGSGGRDDGSIGMPPPGQEILERSSVLIADDRVEARLEIALPARGRRVKGQAASRLLTRDLPRIVERSLLRASLDVDGLRAHVRLHLDQEHVRGRLATRGLVAFLADGAVLPRRSGDSDRPLQEGAVPLASPESLRVTFELPGGRSISGMGVPEGITVIIGGGYHGKSTVLRAVERGVYPHVGGDGREWVVTRPDAVAIRAEDGRAVTGVDISPFIGDLPSGADTRDFSTANASGSTSQAANLIEALEAGASALLIDEDTSATNFMIRDARMRRLIPASREPITPFIDRVRALYEERGVSTVLVAGGSGAFFDVADHVIAMDAYVPRDVTAEAKALAPDPHAASADDGAPGPVFDRPLDRRPEGGALRPAGKSKPARARGRGAIQFGREIIALDAVSQLVDPAQTEAIARILDLLPRELEGGRSIREAVEAVLTRLDDDGLDTLSPYRGHPGYLARPRPHEVHAALNRYRGLRSQRASSRDMDERSV